MEEEDHIHSTQFSSLIVAFAAATQSSRAAAIGSPSLFLSSLFCSTTAHTLLCSWCLFIGKNDATYSSSYSTMVAAKIDVWYELLH